VVTEATEEVALAAAVATEEVGEFRVGLAEGAILVRCLLGAGKCSLAAEWACGVATTGTAAHGVVSTGVAETGAVVIGIAAIGTTGMVETGAVVTGTEV